VAVAANLRGVRSGNDRKSVGAYVHLPACLLPHVPFPCSYLPYPYLVRGRPLTIGPPYFSDVHTLLLIRISPLVCQSTSMPDVPFTCPGGSCSCLIPTHLLYLQPCSPLSSIRSPIKYLFHFFSLSNVLVVYVLSLLSFSLFFFPLIYEHFTRTDFSTYLSIYLCA
jgi:hypothetical protein